MYKLFLCLRYLRKRRIAFFAVGAVCLCVAMVLIVVSVMGGFLQMVKDRSRGMLGDLIVENGALQGFPHYEELIQRVKTNLPDQIAEATPVIITYGVLRFPEDQITKAVQIVGINLEETYRVNDFKNGLFYEKYYPGTTTLGPQKEPRYGLNAEERIVLPPELEAARQKWESTATREEIDKAWRFSRPLFELEQKYLKELNRGEISSELRTAFDGQFEKLHGSSKVSVAEKGKKWRIGQPVGSYIIEKIDGRLIVSYAQYEGPGFYAPTDEASREPSWKSPELPGVIIGTDLIAKRLRSGEYDRDYYRGTVAQLTFVPLTAAGHVEDATGMPQKPFRYADDSRTGVYDIDSMSVYIDFKRLQKIIQMDDSTKAEETGRIIPQRTTQVQIKLKPGIDAEKAREAVLKEWKVIEARELHQAYSPELLQAVQVKTWEQKQARFIAAVEKEKYLVTVLFGVISVVAVFLVGCIFYMIVQQKTRDIGIVKSVGATSLGVAGIFISYGAAVGVVGGALGTLIGTVFVWYINDIQDMLAWFSPELQVWNPEVYAFDSIPNHVNGLEATVIYGIAILASILGSVIAAWRAARIWPVESLRYE